MPVRIYEIAKKLGLESKVVLAKAKDLGIAHAKVASSTLDKITAEYLEEQLGWKPAPPAPEPAPAPPPPKPAPPVRLCEGESFFTRSMCLREQCRKPGNAALPVCVEFRRQMEPLENRQLAN